MTSCVSCFYLTYCMEHDSCNACLLELSQTSKNSGRKGNELKKTALRSFLGDFFVGGSLEGGADRSGFSLV